MSKVLVTEEYLEDIADAIRGKLSSSDTYTPGQMAGAIESIPSGGITPTGTINITGNGTVDVTQYATANVNVSGGGAIFPSDAVGKKYSGNLGTYTFDKSGYYAILGAIDGYSSSTISYSVIGATVLDSDNQTKANGSWGSAATGVLLHAEPGDTITITGANFSRQVMIVIYLTNRISSLSNVTLGVNKDADCILSLGSIAKTYGFYISGSTGDYGVDVVITSTNTLKWSDSTTSPVRLHKYGAYEGNGAISCTAKGSSYSTNYAMLFEAE